MKTIKEYQLFPGDEIQAEGTVRVVKCGMHNQSDAGPRPCVVLEVERTVADEIEAEQAAGLAPLNEAESQPAVPEPAEATDDQPAPVEDSDSDDQQE